MSATDRAVRLVALAYGCGRHLEDVADKFAVSTRTQEGGPDDEENSNVAEGFYVTKQTETLMQAGRAINAKDAEQRRLLAGCDADTLRAAQEWSDTHRLAPRGRGLAYRVSEFEHWKTATQKVVRVPRARPTTRVLDALSDAELDGPLRSLLMFAATQDAHYWPEVRLHAVACGHAGWACDEAGLLLAIGECRKDRHPESSVPANPAPRATDLEADFRLAYSDVIRAGYRALSDGGCCPYAAETREYTAWTYGWHWAERRGMNPCTSCPPAAGAPLIPRRRQSDRAKAYGMRSETFAHAVRAVRALLEEWLHRAAIRLLEVMAPESTIALNHGEPSAIMSETWLHLDRYEPSHTLALSGGKAIAHCRRHPAQNRLYPPAWIRLAAERRTAATWKVVDTEAVALLEEGETFWESKTVTAGRNK